MKKFLTFVFCSLVFGFTATAFSADPNTTLPPLKIVQCTLPPRACDCAPCTCDPATCVCPGCANGCKKAGASTIAETPYEAGIELPQIPTVQYRQQCVNGVCSLVPVQLAYAPPQAAPVAASNVCPCCGMAMTPEQMANMKAKAPIQYAAPVMYSSGAYADDSCGDVASGDTSNGRRGPIRRILGRIFRRGARGGCGG